MDKTSLLRAAWPLATASCHLPTAHCLLLTASCLLLWSCSAPPPDDTSYLQQIAADRAAKDRLLREGADSPVPKNRQAEFLPLSYFAPDSFYSVPAAFTAFASPIKAQMPTSTGQVRPMEKVGTLEFTLKGRLLTLSAFVETGSRNADRLFVPFTDLTSGAETYPAGRYLDLDRTRTGIYVIDFNRAYHPFCYFNPAYDCPFPPPENRLPVPVRAGERLPAAASSAQF